MLRFLALPLFFQVSSFALTSDLFSVFLLNLNGVSARHHSKWYWFMTNNLSLLIHEIDNETWVKAFLSKFLREVLSVHFSGDVILYFSNTAFHLSALS